MATKNSKNSKYFDTKFYCNICNYECSKKQHLTQHFMTKTHKTRDGNQVATIGNILETTALFNCVCGKSYGDRSGLWKHKKKCNYKNSENKQNIEQNNNHDNEADIEQQITQITPELIMSILQQNKDLQLMIMHQNNTIIELSKNNTTINNESHINSHNKSFNLNFFLNETCKDAMNIMDFVDSLKIQLSDLENVGKLGFVQGISNIIVNNLNLLDETMRPIHCTDSKREVMYVKDDNKWEKENDNKQKIRKAIKHVAHKNTKLLPEFRQKYPNCDKSISKLSDKYDKLVIEAFGGKGDNDAEKEDKIIRNIAREVTIEK